MQILESSQRFLVAIFVAVAFLYCTSSNANAQLATGGTVTNINVGGVPYRVHTFTGSGTFQALVDIPSLEYLVVAGGGGGGTDFTRTGGWGGGGGGGAGGMLTGTMSVSSGPVSVVVGQGGSGGANGVSATGGDGTDSSLAGIVATGGGGGGGIIGAFNTDLPGRDGGSGGGATGYLGGVSGVGGGIGVVGQGNNGGNTSDRTRSAGGGGKGSAGSPAPNNTSAGGGGLGLASTISGSSIVYAAGGDGIGAAGAVPRGGASASNNTGDGGSGGNFVTGGSGGSGIVIVRYIDSSASVDVTQAPTEGTADGEFTITLSNALPNATTVTYTIGGTATNGTDYTSIATPGTAVVPAMSTQVTVPIVITDDSIAEGDETVVITLTGIDNGAVIAAGPDDSATATITDDDVAGITVTPTSGLTTTEAGGTATFTVVLDSEPTGDVVIGLTSDNTDEGTVAPASLTFTALDWDSPQTVTVTGVDDAIADGAVAYNIETAAAVSTDVNYGGVDPSDVAVTNTDDDVAGITVTPTSGLTTTEAGGTATFTVVLDSEPTADVVIGLTSDNTDEGTVAPASLTFTALDWDSPQTVTVTGVDDAIADGAVAYNIETAAAVSTDVNYGGVDPSDVAVTNTDDDVAGITVTPTSGLTTTEAGGTATFTVVLDSEPAGDVVIGLTSDNTDEGTVAPASLTFTALDWDSPQTVTVTGVDDAIADGAVAYNIETAAAVSTDVNYGGVDPSDVAVTNTDDDVAGITVTPTSGLTTTEAGGTATFTVVLDSEPTADVVIGLTSDNTDEGTVAPASLTFTALDWDSPQTVTVTGVDDAVADGAVAYNIETAAAVSTDVNYGGVDPSDVAVTNTDDDVAGITVTPTSGLTTTEAGGTATFTVVLDSEPTADVVIGLTSDNTDEGTVAPASLTFTALDWDSPQTVTVTGVDDAIADGAVAYNIETAAAVSTDVNYGGVDPSDVAVTNTDDDVAGITVTPTSGLTTTEAGGTATFTVVLDSEPTADVVIGLTSDNTDEGTVAPASLTFTALDWDSPQTVTVTGVDDAVADGAVAYNIETAAAVSTDVNYGGVDPSDVAVTNTDDDVAGITVTPTSGLTTTEAGGTATFTVVLDSEPTADVVIGLTSDNTDEGTVAPASLTFTALDWDSPQTVTVTGVDDAVADGAVAYNIETAAAVSTDVNYGGVDPSDVAVTNTDDDVAGITVTPTSGLTTTEAGGTATFTVVLDSEPTGDVVIGLTSDNTDEGTVAPASLTFTALDWDSPQTVTVTGVDDAIADGAVAYNIETAAAVSTDVNYGGVDPSDVAVTNTDDDVAGITVTPTSGLTTTEAGGTATFTVVLDSEPTGDVVIGLTSDNTDEGTVAPASLTFTASDWDSPQTVTVTGVDDAVADGAVAYNIETAAAVSTDVNYGGVDPSDVAVTNTDDDVAGITVTPTSGLTTTEAGGTATFTVVLDSEPTADVVIGLTSDNTDEGTVAPASLTFTALDWDSPQTVTVTGVDDAIADGAVAYNIETAAAVSTDVNYGGVDPSDVAVTNTDDDVAGITVTPTSGLTTTEAGGTATFTVVLDSEPTADVVIGLTSDNTDEGTVAPASLTFTALDWDSPQTVTVTGVDDAIADGAVAYNIETAAAVSTDVNYGGVDPSDVAVTNTDDDVAGITVTPTSGLTTTEAGGTATFTVVLDSEPTADVVIGLTSDNTDEGTVAPASLTFTALDWDSPQTVTVTGVDDAIADGAVAYNIETAAAVSTDVNYGGVDPSDVAVTNTDDDVAGITVTPTSGLTTTEAGGTATFTVVLDSEPTADVVIGLTSDNTDEGTVAPASLTFTALDWDSPQTVTVTGVDDAIADGAVAYNIETAAAVSTDVNYGGVDPSDVAVTNTDDDVAGITVTPTSGLTTTEAGGTATFTVVLDSEPAGDVVIGLTSDNTDEGTVAPASLTFTALDWDSPQTVTVTGVDDAIADGAVAYNIETAAAVSTDVNYGGVDPSDVAVTNTDDDVAGITVTPTSGLTTTEAGGTATFTVVLDSEPTADVVIGLTSDNTDEGTVAPASLTFTALDWDSPQTVTVTGVDDAIADGAVAYNIETAAAVSTDVNYGGVDPSDVAVTNTDDDVAGITVTPTSGLTTTEAGGTATFTVVLDSEPTADVVIGLTSDNTDEGTVAPASLTFTALDWDSPQTVTVTGVDDAIADGAVAYNIETAAAVSTDVNYGGVDPSDVAVTNTDDDVAGITVTPTSGLTTTEAGGTATFTVVLDSEPTGDVVIGLTSDNTDEGTVAPASLTFTASDWDSPQTVTVTGVDDAVADGAVAYNIETAAAVSTDVNYGGVDPSDVAVTNTDDDVAGITVTPTSGLTTTEAGGTATFTVVLDSEPTADVVIGLTSDNTDEGTVAPASLTFTALDWDSPQTVTVTGVDDAIADGAVAYNIETAAAVSTDVNYGGVDPSDVAVTNTDDDVAGITVTPTSGLTTTEAGGTATFTVVLDSEPTGDVVIGLTSDNTDEGTVAPASLTFTALDWDSPQTVTVTGVDDAVADGAVAYNIETAAAVSTDVNYGGVDPSDVAVTNTDDDVAGITVTPTSGLTTTEAGGTATFTVVLDSEPTADVVIGLTSDNTDEGTVAPASLTFTALDWDSPQTVTVTGVDDAVADGAVAYNIETAAAVSTDGNYSGVDPSDVAVTNTDDDVAGITVTPTSGLTTTEAGGTATFTVVLDSEPTGDVVIGLTSDNTDEGTVAPASLTFTASDWDSPQTVTVTGVDDAVADGAVAYNIETAAAVSTDVNYGGVDPSDVAVTNTDDDVAGITVTPTSGLTTTEAGGTATFTVVLDSEPTADVVIGLTSDNTDEGTVAPASLTFTALDWDSPQTVTVTGVDDAIADGAVAYNIETAAAVSTDVNYGGVDPSDVAVTNTDDDVAGITVTPTSGLTTTEAGGTATFTVVLDSEPTGDVVIGLTSDNTDEGTVAPASLTFTALDWDSPQTVTVTGVDDAVADGAVAYNIETAAAVSTDVNYGGVDPSDVAVTNTDDDVAGITVTPTSGLTTTEAGGTATFTVVLDSEPTGDVVIGLTSDNTDEGTVAPASLTFTALDWDSPQTVTVTGVDDAVADGAVAYNIETAAAVSTDVNYGGVDPSDVAVTNTDDDVAGITVTPTSGLTTTEAGGTATFTVVLDSEPTADVVIGLTSDNTDEGTVAPASLTFTALDWDSPQTVTVTGVDDAVADGAVAYNIVTAAAVSTDVNYGGVDPSDVAVTNTDDDVAAVTIANTTDGMEPGTDGVLTVSQTLVSLTDTVIAYSVAGTATAGTDYTTLSGTVTIPAGSLTTPIDVAVLDDGDIEGSETVVVTLTSITSGAAVLGATVAATNTIGDEDETSVSIANTTDGTEPGTDGVLTVSQTLVSLTDTVIAYSVAGTATAGTDYTTLSGTVTIPAGSLTAPIEVAVLDDVDVESAETVVITLDSIISGTAALSANVSATNTISDDDGGISDLVASAFDRQAYNFVSRRLTLISRHSPSGYRSNFSNDCSSGKHVNYFDLEGDINGVSGKFALSTGKKKCEQKADPYLWAEGQFAYFDDTRRGDETVQSTGSFFVGYAGFAVPFNMNTTVGVMGQVDWLEDRLETGLGETDGLGWAFGPYLSHRFMEGLQLDVRAMWGRSQNNARQSLFGGSFEGSFDTERWLVEAIVSGTTQINDFKITPSAKVFYMREDWDDFSVTDGNRVVNVPGNDAAIGTLSSKLEISRKFDQHTYAIEPFASAELTWAFENPGIYSADGSFQDGSDVSASVSAGVSISNENTELRLEGAYNGLGTNGVRDLTGKISLKHKF